MDVRACWTLQQAQSFLRAFTPEIEAAGYIVGLYGSVIRYGRGRDLDLMFSPTRPKRFRVAPGDVMSHFRLRYKDPTAIRPYQSPMGHEAWQLVFQSGKIVDCSFRGEHESRLEDIASGDPIHLMPS